MRRRAISSSPSCFTSRATERSWASATVEPGEAQARGVLMDLASSPATAKHLATKLARHFAGDDPPPALVDRLEQGLSRQRRRPADRLSHAVESPEPWAAQPLKFKNPWEWSVSALRAVGSRDLPAQAGRGPSEAARPADLAARLTRRLGRHRRQLGGPDALVLRGRSRAAHRRQGRLHGRRPRACRETLSWLAQRARRALRSPAPKAPPRGSRCCSSAPNS